jgi:purine-nucleoside phosphorylase
MKRLGIKTLIVSNASGGMNSAYKKGELAVINDHINFMGANPLIGPNDDRLGLRFPDMIEPYSKRLITLAHRAAKKQKVTLHDAVYIGVTGPCLETKAEYRLMRQMGADLVGMSTVPEVIVAVHAGLEVLGMSVVTDLCIPEHLEPVNIEQIIKTAQTAEPILNRLIIDIIKDI